jgi:transcriptional regulator with XRE-family HTH domain
MSSIGERITKEREKRSLSIRGLALKVNISHTTISRIEKDLIKPGADTTEKLASFFRVSSDYLLYGVKEEKKKNLYNVLSKSPLYFSDEYLEMIDAIDLLTKGELQQALGIIKYVVSQTGDSLEDRKTRKEKSDIS